MNVVDFVMLSSDQGFMVMCTQCQWSTNDPRATHECPRDPDILEAKVKTLSDALFAAADHFAALAKYTDERKSPKDTALLVQWLYDVRTALKKAGRIP